MDRLQQAATEQDLFLEYRDTPIGSLLAYHNGVRDFENYEKAQVLVSMCMDNRKQLRIPDNFAYILRSGGGNLRASEFKVSYAIAIGGVSAIALIAHNDCGMVNLHGQEERFVEGLVNKGGWERGWAEEHFKNFSPIFEIGNEIDFVLSETQRIRQRYPKVLVAPLYYNTNDNRLYQILEDLLGEEKRS